MSNIIEEVRDQDKLNFGSWILKQWEKRLTIVVILSLILVSGVWIAGRNDLKQIISSVDFFEWLLIASSAGIVFSFWFFTRKPPQISKGKIGIIIAIVCESKKERQRLRADFILSLKLEFQKNHSQHFEILELSEYHVSQINSARSVFQYHSLTKGHFLIYGKCKIREHQGKANYVLELEASVIHSQIPPEVSKELSQEMRALIPKQQIFPVSEELTGFSVTREVMVFASEYIVGLAGLLSGDVRTSFNLHADLWRNIKNILETEQEVLQGCIFIQNKLPTRLVIEGIALAGVAYQRKEPEYLNEMHRCLSVVQEVDPNNYDAHLLRGIYYFLNDRNIVKAKEEIIKSKNDRDAAWRFSEAFLNAYEGDLEQAHKIYQRAFRENIRESVPLRVEMFIKDVLDHEPDKIQLWYCLGMINYFSKDDLELAEKDFVKFVEEANKLGKFSKSVEFASKYINKIYEKSRV